MFKMRSETVLQMQISDLQFFFCLTLLFFRVWWWTTCTRRHMWSSCYTNTSSLCYMKTAAVSTPDTDCSGSSTRRCSADHPSALTVRPLLYNQPVIFTHFTPTFYIIDYSTKLKINQFGLKQSKCGGILNLKKKTSAVFLYWLSIWKSFINHLDFL